MSSINVIVSVDWEGRSLLVDNLDTMKAFRVRHPDVPMLQFLNPAYYTKENANITDTTKKIASVLLPDDEHGLHIHAWRTLVERAGVAFRSKPVFIEMTEEFKKKVLNPPDWNFYKNDEGFEVPIDRYEVDELVKILQTSIELLTSEGFRRPHSFRAGGCMGGINIQEALTQSAFTLDSSAGNIPFMARRLGDDIPWTQWANSLWGHIDDLTQPYEMNTSSGHLWQMPINGHLADYANADEMLAVFEKNVALWQSAPDQSAFVSIGFHQETAARFLDRVDEVVAAIKTMATKQNLPVVFTASPLKYLPLL